MSATINIPGCSKPLVLEECEVAWLDAQDGLRLADFGCGRYVLATVYECALRDACFERLGHCTVTIYYFADEPEGSRWAIDIVRMSSPHGYFGSLLHAWRAAAKHLHVGPWTQ